MLFGDKSGDRLVGHLKLHWLLAGKLLHARLLGVEVVESWLARKNLAILRDLETLRK